ncbi:hypothetical protein V1478_008781 [Vespula squamosa]|uniref:Uncharacterized protein n=1 Tax=Vespula squamosa TaxID=30214 RepID=A0ABD2AUI6_VESSQ
MESFGGENNDVEIPSVVILPDFASTEEKFLGTVLKKSPISISSNPESVEHANEEKRNIVQAC